jgi:hypothetical protein
MAFLLLHNYTDFIGGTVLRQNIRKVHGTPHVDFEY